KLDAHLFLAKSTFLVTKMIGISPRPNLTNDPMEMFLDHFRDFEQTSESTNVRLMDDFLLLLNQRCQTKLPNIACDSIGSRIHLALGRGIDIYAAEKIRAELIDLEHPYQHPFPGLQSPRTPLMFSAIKHSPPLNKAVAALLEKGNNRKRSQRE